MKFLRNMYIYLAIWWAFARDTAIWTAETLWVALGGPKYTEPAVVVVVRSVINWINWWQRARKEEIDESQVIDLVKRLGINMMVRGP